MTKKSKKDVNENDGDEADYLQTNDFSWRSKRKKKIAETDNSLPKILNIP